MFICLKKGETISSLLKAKEEIVLAPQPFLVSGETSRHLKSSFIFILYLTFLMMYAATYETSSTK